MSFPTNTLPESFQEDHGTTSLLDDEEDEKAAGVGGVVDEDLEMRDAGDRVWLCKVCMLKSGAAVDLRKGRGEGVVVLCAGLRGGWGCCGAQDLVDVWLVRDELQR